MQQKLRMHEVRILPEFKRLEAPLTDDELEKLEDELLTKGCKQPFLTWNNYLLMNFAAFEFCKKHNIDCQIRKKRYPSQEVVISEICKIHLRLTDCSDIMRKYLIGSRFYVEKELAKAQPHEYDSQYSYDDSAMKTRMRLAREFNVSGQTIYKYGIHADTLNRIADLSESLFLKIMKQEIKVSIETLQAILQMSPVPRKQAIERLEKGQSSAPSTRIIESRSVTSSERIMGITVKETPKYDPNSELKSLIYTVPTWMSSITRVQKVANMLEADPETKQKLRYELLSLTGVISNFLCEMEESNNG